MRDRFKSNEVFVGLCDLLQTDAPELKDIPLKDKRNLLGFFEEIALMVNSGLIKKEVAHYMFGPYVCRCWESKHFWINMDGAGPHMASEGIYWQLFKGFAEDMQKMEEMLKNSKNYRLDPKSYRL